MSPVSPPERVSQEIAALEKKIVELKFDEAHMRVAKARSDWNARWEGDQSKGDEAELFSELKEARGLFVYFQEKVERKQTN